MAFEQRRKVRPAVMALFLAGAILATGCGTTDGSLSKPLPESLFYSRLYELSRAYESLNVDRIAVFYSPGVVSVTRDLPFKNDNGLAALRTTLERYAAAIKSIKVVLTDTVQVRLSPGQVSTMQGFHAECTTKEGAQVTWDGRHAATWEYENGEWVIENEFFSGPPEVKPAQPIGISVLASLEESPAPMTPAEPAAPPEPMRVELLGTSAAEAKGPAGAALEAPKAAAPVPAPVPVERPARPKQGRAGSFVTPDWSGEPVYVIHFSSFLDKKRAEREALRISKETKLPARAVQVDLGGKGIWYRVVAGEFRTAEKALAFRNEVRGTKFPDVGPVFRMAKGTGN